MSKSALAERYAALIATALRSITEAAMAFHEQTMPATWVPRLPSRGWSLGTGLRVTLTEDDVSVHVGDSSWSIRFPQWDGANHLGHVIVEYLGGHPRRVLRTVRRLEALTAYLRARAAGRQRAADQILADQANAAAALDAMAALTSIAKGNPS